MFTAVCRPQISRRERSWRPRNPCTGGPSPTGRSGSAEFDDLPLPSPFDFGTPRPIRFQCGSEMVDLQGDCHRQPPGNHSETASRGRLHGQGTARTGPRAVPMPAGRCGVAASSAPLCGSVPPEDGTKHGRRQESSGTRERIGEANRMPRPASRPRTISAPFRFQRSRKPRAHTTFGGTMVHLALHQQNSYPDRPKGLPRAPAPEQRKQSEDQTHRRW
jgi:hypothetical protein